ncbi:MAG: hypothetical protein J6M62_03820 [Selenomonadaceae bacterium]|nr:hypothetical protein [Selenomonadaceae bacterium]MBO6304195.1 hypothetical protein [Selenomonadaceae bacterium]
MAWIPQTMQNLQFQEALKKLEEQKQRDRMAIGLKNYAKSLPATAGYVAGGLLGDALNRWLNRDRPVYKNGVPVTNEDITQMRNAGFTFGDGNETSPEGAEYGIGDGNINIQNMTANDAKLLGDNLFSNYSNLENAFKTFQPQGASNLLGAGFSTGGSGNVANVGEAVKNLGEEFDLLKMFGGR